MKKFLFFAAALLVMASCDNKPANRADRSDDDEEATAANHDTSVADSGMQEEVAQENTMEVVDLQAQRMDSIASLEAVAFDGSTVPYIDLGHNNKLYLRKTGELGYNNPNFSNGKYLKQDNGGYLLYWSEGDIPTMLGVIYGDRYYPVFNTLDGGDLEYLNFYFASNFFSLDNPFQDKVSFDPSSMTVTYATEGGQNTLPLPSPDSPEIGIVKWDGK